MTTLYQNRCRNCNATFRSGAKNTRYCSPRCNILHKTDKSSGCWLWTGARYNQGYGSMRINGKQIKSHRASYEAFVGSADGLLVCHRCDIPLCCNPDHLFLGTHRDNVHDMIAKGRARLGSEREHYRERSAKIRLDTRRTIEVAREYGISTRAVRRIRNSPNT